MRRALPRERINWRLATAVPDDSARAARRQGEPRHGPRHAELPGAPDSQPHAVARPEPSARRRPTGQLQRRRHQAEGTCLWTTINHGRSPQVNARRVSLRRPRLVL